WTSRARHSLSLVDSVDFSTPPRIGGCQSAVASRQSPTAASHPTLLQSSRQHPSPTRQQPLISSRFTSLSIRSNSISRRRTPSLPEQKLDFEVSSTTSLI
ncbi:hypothetical protein LINPERPRIM_LOCUS2540, partial [Linum perenne]